MDFTNLYWATVLSFGLMAIHLARLVITGQRTDTISIAGKRWTRGEPNFLGTSIFYSVAAIASLAFALVFAFEALG